MVLVGVAGAVLVGLVLMFVVVGLARQSEKDGVGSGLGAKLDAALDPDQSAARRKKRAWAFVLAIALGTAGAILGAAFNDDDDTPSSQAEDSR